MLCYNIPVVIDNTVNARQGIVFPDIEMGELWLRHKFEA